MYMLNSSRMELEMLKPKNVIFDTTFGYESYYRDGDGKWYDECCREVIYRRICDLLDKNY